MTQPPKKIYLQWYGDGHPDDPGEVSENDVSWCRDKIYDSDIEYVRLTPDLRRLLPPKPITPRQIDFEDDEDDAQEYDSMTRLSPAALQRAIAAGRVKLPAQKNLPVVQRKEQRASTPPVVGSNPTGQTKRKHKYNAVPTQDSAGRLHPSKLQATVTERLRERYGALIPEISIPLSHRKNDRIRIDALVIHQVNEDGTFKGEWVEIKGQDLPTGIQKRRRFEDKYLMRITVIRK